jgi:hypothetical protein
MFFFSWTDVSCAGEFWRVARVLLMQSRRAENVAMRTLCTVCAVRGAAANSRSNATALERRAKHAPLRCLLVLALLCSVHGHALLEGREHL